TVRAGSLSSKRRSPPSTLPLAQPTPSSARASATAVLPTTTTAAVGDAEGRKRLGVPMCSTSNPVPYHSSQTNPPSASVLLLLLFLLLLLSVPSRGAPRLFSAPKALSRRTASSVWPLMTGRAASRVLAVAPWPQMWAWSASMKVPIWRSEERRVGEEWRSGGALDGG